MNWILVRNIFSNWIGLVATILVGFLLTPFVIRELGHVGYGFWALLQSLLSYMFLLEFGVRASLNRHLAKFFALRSSFEANRVINTGLVVYLAVCLIVIVSSVALGLTFQQMFSFHELDAQAILWAVVLVGTSVGLQFPAAVFESVLTGYQRYDLMNVVSIASLLVRTGVIVLSLKLGYGVLGIAWATFLGSLLLLVLNYVLAARVHPDLCLNLSLAEVGTFTMLGHHSVFAFVLIGATRIITDAGNILVGAFVGAAAVTFYAIAGSLTTYALSVISGISTTIAPRASDLEARGDHEGLKALCMTGTRFILLIGLPILLTFVISGDIFVTLWVGEGYGESYGPLILLSVSWAFNFIQSASACILMGVSRHRMAAWLVLAQAALNVVVSLYLVRSMGMMGVAWGALIASVVMNMVFQVHALRMLDIPLARFFVQAIVPAGIALVPFAVVLVTLFASYTPPNLLVYFVCVGIAVACMALCVPWLGLTRDERDTVWRCITGWMQQAGLSACKS